jgi:hypothetical protein
MVMSIIGVGSIGNCRINPHIYRCFSGQVVAIEAPSSAVGSYGYYMNVELVVFNVASGALICFRMVPRSSAVRGDVQLTVGYVVAELALIVDIGIIGRPVGQSGDHMQPTGACAGSAAACVAEFAGCAVRIGRVGVIVGLAPSRTLRQTHPVYLKKLRNCDFCTPITSNLRAVTNRIGSTRSVRSLVP